MSDAMPPAKGRASEKPCPICAKPATVEDRPFCSKHCADIDLNRWLNGVYAVPATSVEDEEGLGEDDPEGRA